MPVSHFLIWRTSNFFNSINDLGYVICPGQLEVSSHTVDAVRDL